MLYTFEQLCAIGSGAPVMSGDPAQMGSGEPVEDPQGQPVVYGLAATYRLAQDIALPAGEVWQLPAGFTGRIAPAQTPQTRSVYDGERQAVLVYHPYQLAVMAQDDAAEQPVLDGDGNAAAFGMGNLVYPDGDADGFLTYSPSNRYILSAAFCSDLPLAASLLRNADDSWGRDFPGQVLKQIGGKTYILIGNAQQLEAIGTDAKVYTAVYQAKWNTLHARWEVDQDDDGNPIMLYGGDADLLQSQNGKKDYPFGEDGIEEAEGSLVEMVGRCGVNQDTGEIDPNMDIEDSGATYSAGANYIVFRDIDLNDLNGTAGASNWSPLTFSGAMIGAKSENGEALWDETASNITATGRPIISNLRVIQDTSLDVGESMGLGFFATLQSNTGKVTGGTEAESFGSTGAVTVSGLILQSPMVYTLTTETHYDQTLINGLLSGLGTLVGGVLDGLLAILGIRIGLRDVLTNLLDARKADPTALATGALAGRVVGEVRIENCQVIHPDIQNNNSATGGFVGYGEGVTSYATEGIGEAVDLLSGILNLIPGLGLGDLITILLDNGLTVGKLAPTGYTAPEIRDCQVINLSGSIGNSAKPYAGGFIGLQVGTKISGCAVTGGSYTVLSSAYGGGFSGLARDAEIQGLLSNLGVDLFRLFLPQSLLYDCQVQADTLTVTGGEYQGGFVGALANSYAVNDALAANLTVTAAQQTAPAATGSCAGGFAGIATTGWVTNLGAGETTSNGLLDDVGDLLTKLLSQNPGQAQMLLSLAGVAPSAVMGCTLNPDGGKTVAVQGVDFVGGMLGKGDGAYLTPSSAENLAELSPLAELLEQETVASKACSLRGLTAVTASGDYAGGLAGSLGADSVGGLLNSTIGVASFLGFSAEQITLEGGYTVSADRYAGGAFGEAVGGTGEDIKINGIQAVTAGNYAGGFVGVCGPGDLAGTGGLTLNLLG